MNNELKQPGQFWYYFAIKMVKLIELLKMSNSLDNHERVFTSLHIAPFAINGSVDDDRKPSAIYLVIIMGWRSEEVADHSTDW